MAKIRVAKVPGAESLLVELLTEELPPKALKVLSDTFATALFDNLRQRDLLTKDSEVRAYATPRRLAASISSVLAQGPDKAVKFDGPNVNVALDAEGKPTQALLGFARKQGVDVKQLERQSTAKGDVFVYRTLARGGYLHTGLDLDVQDAVKKLPIPKVMRWAAGDAEFVRPVHGLVMLHGSKVVPGEVLGASSSNHTLGHRFLTSGPIAISHADDYERLLRSKGRVEPAFTNRKDLIAEKLARAAGKDVDLVMNQALLDEITALVEWPAAYGGAFDREFLEVPRECLILSMQQHQKYVPMAEKATGKLLPRFLFISNLETKTPRDIIHGNERVLRARLADARFFFDQDRRTRLEERVEKLKDVIYHNKLGSQFDRVMRIRKAAGEIARSVGAAVEWVERAAYLSKADLLTSMVGEFPELQGIMGYHYAFHDHEDPHVAMGILEHYLPRYAGDALPLSQDSLSLALADKLDTLVGIYGIGLIPTGDKDPNSLRRQALGIVRILVERKNLPSLDIITLLEHSRDCFPSGVLMADIVPRLHTFILERLRSYLREKDYAPDEIDAVLSSNPTRLDQVLPQLDAIKQFRALPEGMALSSANKRIHNILRQANFSFDGLANPSLLKETSEINLHRKILETRSVVDLRFSTREYKEALFALAGLRPFVDQFFEKVHVNDKELTVRENRFRLLGELNYLMNRVADISKLAVEK